VARPACDHLRAIAFSQSNRRDEAAADDAYGDAGAVVDLARLTIGTAGTR
jgi:hypothetical protein